MMKLIIKNKHELKKYVTEENLTALSLLACYLETEITDDMFDIESFRNVRPENIKPQDINENNVDACGTIGCAVGWAGHAFGCKESDVHNSVFGGDYFSFNKLSDRLFGNLEYLFIEPVIIVGVGDVVDVWDFMFSSLWRHNIKQRTREATIERIRQAVNVMDSILKSEAVCC